MHVIAAKAVCFKEALQPEFKEYQKQVIKNSKVLAQEMLGYDFDLVSGGTDTHLILIDLASKNITGLEAEIALGKAGIFVNKNTVPFEKRSPQVTSGLRIGTPVLTTRGMKEQEIKVVAGLIRNILENMDNEKVVKNSQATVAELCKAFPVYDFL